MSHESDAFRLVLRDIPTKGWFDVSVCRHGSPAALLPEGTTHRTRDSFAVLLFTDYRPELRVNGTQIDPYRGRSIILLGPSSTWEKTPSDETTAGGAAFDHVAGHAPSRPAGLIRSPVGRVAGHAPSRPAGGPGDDVWLCMANPVWRTDRSAPAVGQLALIADTGPIRWYQEQLSLLYHEHLDQRGEFRHGLCSALFHTIAAQIVLNSSDFPRPSYTRNDIQRLCGEIKANPTRRFRLAELARMAGLSPRRLSRVFRAEVGTTPKEYEIRTRLAYAEFLLSNQGMKVSEVATACGYPDPFLFSRQFKQHTGRTPSRTRVHGRR